MNTNQQLEFPEWKPKLYWFHLFKALFENGDAAEMGGNCFLCYCAIKARINFDTGRTFPSYDTIAQDTGLNRKSVIKHIKTLVEMGYLKIKSASKSNTYKVIEKIPIDYTGDDGTIESTMAEFDYVPAGVQKAMHDIRNVVFKGSLPENSVVRIDNLTINVQINPQASNPQQIVVSKLLQGVNLMDTFKSGRNVVRK